MHIPPFGCQIPDLFVGGQGQQGPNFKGERMSKLIKPHNVSGADQEGGGAAAATTTTITAAGQAKSDAASRTPKCFKQATIGCKSSNSQAV